MKMTIIIVGSLSLIIGPVGIALADEYAFTGRF
jgi:hypothetical protein